MLKKLRILGLPFILFSCQLSGQVESKAYDRMLDTLLSHTVDEISVKSLVLKREDMTLLDAREKKEYDVSHISSARWIGYETFGYESLKDIPKSQKIVIYCSVGYRSEKIAEKLIQKGYKHVWNLYGGIFEWKNQGNSLEDIKGETEKVHAYNRFWGQWLKKGEKVY